MTFYSPSGFLDDDARNLGLILESVGIDYGFIGGFAMRHWASKSGFDWSTDDLDIVVNRIDLENLKNVLLSNGYSFSKSSGDVSFRKVHVMMADEVPSSRPEDKPLPCLDKRLKSDGYFLFSLDDVLSIKVDAKRPKDIGHLRRFFSMGLSVDG
jgi:hypothetical protein